MPSRPMPPCNHTAAKTIVQRDYTQILWRKQVFAWFTCCLHRYASGPRTAGFDAFTAWQRSTRTSESSVNVKVKKIERTRVLPDPYLTSRYCVPAISAKEVRCRLAGWPIALHTPLSSTFRGATTLSHHPSTVGTGFQNMGPLAPPPV